MDAADRALLVRAHRIDLKRSFSDGIRNYRQTTNFRDAGGMPREAPFDRRGAHRTLSRIEGHTRRALRRTGANRHRAAIRGREAYRYAVRSRFEAQGLGF